MNAETRPTNTATQRFTVGQRVRVLPHAKAPHLTGREGTIVDFPAPVLFGTETGLRQ